jgi:hypothetical protein
MKPGRGNGVLSAITANSEPRSGVSTRRVSNSTTMQSTLSCSSRFGTGVIVLPRNSHARIEGSDRKPGKHTKGAIRRR